MPSVDLEQLARTLFDAYGRGDLEIVASLLSAEVVFNVTNAAGGVDRVEGRDEALARLPDLSGAELRTTVTQVVAVDDERVLTMVEIEARRHGRELHNVAAFLARVPHETVAEIWMVEARPAYSAEFWG